ncbi:helix-turn-helix domain-containing protein [Actinomadura sp. ATCC 31491]|uniref:Helix-turn-helix domain-containing protein n=1 Tax=Actinomadura luzonensis TaxID=2805427 RepID=A0ABT0GA20_9ACTN|nr:DUF6597 domain-containing transcriptional factor [Actinomadura luzonensis]MCK2221449.1 helix-turn-helix domain-containing protein [Actinomadura luzonensis]
MYAERSPDPGLAAVVACHWHRVSESAGDLLVVPDACVDLYWGPGGPFVAGPDTGPVATAAGDVFVGVRFRPGAAAGLFGVPLHALRDQRVPLADLPAAAWPGFALLATAPPVPGGSAIPALHHALTRAVRAAALPAEATRPARSAAPAPAPAPARLAAALRSGRSIAETAWDLGLSERQLHRRSLAAFGYAPKTLQRIIRFQHALRLARAGVPHATVAAEAGYTDQAHLSHDVKRLSGVTLSALAPRG